jgi:hypothetical protein
MFDVLNSSTVRGLAGGGSVWRLDGTSAQVQSLREHLLDLAARSTSVFVHYDGGKPDEPSLEETQALRGDLWRLPASATGHDLASWLYMGNWQLYSRDEPLANLEDLCRADDEGVLRFLSESAVDFIVDSFHDDIEWTIGLASSALMTPNTSLERTRER